VLAGIPDFQSPASFPLSGGIIATSADLPRFLADDGAKTISIARPDLTQGAVIKTFGDQALSKVGQSIKNDVPVPIDAPDMAPYVQAALAGGTDAIVVALPGQQAINFVQAAKQADPKVKLALISTEPGPVQKALGDQSAGIIQAPTILPPLSVKTAEGKRYLNEMKAAGYKNTSGFRLNSWLAMQVLAQVADGLPEVTSSAIFDKLNTTSDLETGLTPPLQWTTPADLGALSSVAPRVFSVCELAVKMTKGTKVKPVTGKFFDALSDQDCPTP
jgi:ABC-type branched-subunit amino acid transport system substrate-binding protein